jgi:hypothetical protein
VQRADAAANVAAAKRAVYVLLHGPARLLLSAPTLRTQYIATGSWQMSSSTMHTAPDCRELYAGTICVCRPVCGSLRNDPAGARRTVASSSG